MKSPGRWKSCRNQRSITSSLVATVLRTASAPLLRFAVSRPDPGRAGRAPQAQRARPLRPRTGINRHPHWETVPALANTLALTGEARYRFLEVARRRLVDEVLAEVLTSSS
jgi:hypothetical protein